MDRSYRVQSGLLALQNAAARHEEKLRNNAVQFISRHLSQAPEVIQAGYIEEIRTGISYFSILMRKNMPRAIRSLGEGKVCVHFNMEDSIVTGGKLLWEGAPCSIDLEELIRLSLKKVAVNYVAKYHDFGEQFANDLAYARTSIPEFEIAPANKGIAIWLWKRSTLDVCEEDRSSAKMSVDKLNEAR